jgi:serine/threonine protein kinase
MAELFRAQRLDDSGSGEPVAIKCLRPELAEDPELLRMFIQEGRIAASLEHPNIARVVDVGVVDDRYYIAQELVDGRDLAAIAAEAKGRSEAVATSFVVAVALEVTQGLAYAHAARSGRGEASPIVHRDISPANILVSFAGDVKLIDFGLAKAVGRAAHTQAGVVKGRLAYMSPEQAGGRAIDHRSDLFSLGVCMYELLAGYAPFLRRADVETLVAVQEGRAPELASVTRGLPERLTSVVDRLLLPDPDARISHATELERALDAIVTTEGYARAAFHRRLYMERLFGSPAARAAARPTDGAGRTPLAPGTSAPVRAGAPSVRDSDASLRADTTLVDLPPSRGVEERDEDQRPTDVDDLATAPTRVSDREPVD